MSIPSRVTGAGNNSSAQNVFRIVFSQALAAPPRLEMWDDNTFSTTAKEIFTGTTDNGLIPYVSGVATSDAAPASNWEPVAAVGGGAVINRLKGSTNFVFLSVATPGAGGNVRFNLVWQIADDTTVPSVNTMNGVIACRFSYSGATPALTWSFNDASAGGNEGAPIWTNITPGAAGSFIRPADSGVTGASVIFTRPTTSVLDCGEVWVTNS